MDKKIISTNNAPAAIGPYSQGIIASNMVFTSGQMPVNPKTGELVVGDIKAETRQCLENIKAILEAAGTGMDNVVKCTVFIRDMNQFGLINEIYAEYFLNDKPARSCVEVARLPKDIHVEIEAIAIVK